MPKPKVDWKKVPKEEYGTSLLEVQAEFQGLGLLNKGSQPIYQDGLKVGKKTKYICKENSCPYTIRIITMENEPEELEL